MRVIFRILLVSLILFAITPLRSQESIAQKWIDVNLNSIRSDFARPPQAARNLWHTSLAMYDAWAAYDSIANPFFLGNSMGDYDCAFDGIPEPTDVVAAQELAMSYAAYQIIRARYHYVPALDTTTYALDQLMTELGLDPNYLETDYSSGDPRDLGNYIAFELLAAAAMDGSNEGSGDFFGYENLVYQPVNDSLPIQLPEYIGNPTIDSVNRYQPLSFLLFCDQIAGTFQDYVPPFIGAEWGHVVPFSLSEEDKTIRTREGIDWPVYHDPGAPPRIDDFDTDESHLHQWNMQLVLNWSKHLTAEDPTIWDVSPASIGNLMLEDLPTDLYDHELFYDFENGGDASLGYAVNPSTGLPYEPQLVKRADYARILAEFWADGPNSETPPGHWFQIYNEIKYHPDFSWQWEGEGAVLTPLEYDVKTYFTLGGTMHDAAIAAWSIKGFYDFVRPVSALRAMAEIGQISDPGLTNYDPTGKGLPLVPGWIELVESGDPLAGEDDIFVDELKVMCWLGPLDEDTCIAGDAPVYDTITAGVGWKLALDWWPYQRPTFITPAFAGYVSGHSTYSRAAAECMTRITGDRFFPGGMGEFYCPQDEFLVFEDGPSTDVTLQWATYQDASDQCSLSRIWGGIHPPADDIPGRLIGYEVGNDAFDFANTYIHGGVPVVTNLAVAGEDLLNGKLIFYPNPVYISEALRLRSEVNLVQAEVSIFDTLGRSVLQENISAREGSTVEISTQNLKAGSYLLQLQSQGDLVSIQIVILEH
jgi:hypothetical protein